MSRSSVFLLVSRGGCGTTWHGVLHCRVLQIAFCRVNNMHRRRIRRGNGRGTWVGLKPHICSWWWSRSLWPCRHETGSQWSSSWEAPGAPCKLAWKRTQKRQRGSLAGVKTKNKKHPADGKRHLTRCASLHLGSRSLPSRWLFYLLSHGR